VRHPPDKNIDDVLSITVMIATTASGEYLIPMQMERSRKCK